MSPWAQIVPNIPQCKQNEKYEKILQRESVFLALKLVTHYKQDGQFNKSTL